MQQRDGFNSRLGFVLASAGSAIGLGNIWGFPTQVANNGGAAFILVYLVVIILLAIPALYAELLIGHHGQANTVDSLKKALAPRIRLAHVAGIMNLVGAVVMLSFYSIVAGWMVAYALAPLLETIGLTDVGQFFIDMSVTRNLLFAVLFIGLTGLVIASGVKSGIEVWSKRLMPLLFIMLIGLIFYVASLPGASEGFDYYLSPDFSSITDPNLIIRAMGQAFFSLSIGVGGMMVYGSYLKRGSELGKLTVTIASLDTCIALLAGLLIVPAIFVAQHSGINVFVDGEIAGGDTLIFRVLPTMFEALGTTGAMLAVSFFFLLTIASLTSTISSTEVPVAYLSETTDLTRGQSTLLVSVIVLAASMTLIFNFDALFGLAVTLLTNYMLPLMGLFYFITVGWLWSRGKALAENTIWQKLFRGYIRYVCPILMSLVFYNVALAN